MYIILKVIKNPVVLYVVSRYATYIIQFVNSLFIAVYLGPYYLGIWGFINLVIGYAAQFNFGIPQSVNVLVSVKKQDSEYTQKLANNGLAMILILSVVIVIFFLFTNLLGFDIGDKYHFNTYLVPILIIVTLTHITGFLINISRVFGQIWPIAVNQSLFPILVLFVIPFFRGDQLLWAMVIVQAMSVIISLLILLRTYPIKIGLSGDFPIFKSIQHKGWYLFIYHASFYLILLSTRSFISANYKVEEFGFFTFSFSLANVVLLLLNSISFLIFPKMINRFASLDNSGIHTLLTNFRSLYITVSHLLIHFVIMCYPLLLYYLPKYQETRSVFVMTALTVVLYSNSFGYLGLLMAKGKDKLIASLSFAALLVNIVASYILVFIVNVSYEYVILATLVTYLIYVLASGYFGMKIIGLPTRFAAVLCDIYPIRMMLPFAVSLIFVIADLSEFYFIIPFAFFLALNVQEFGNIKSGILNIIKNPKTINI